jgi:hypothetical protein
MTTIFITARPMSAITGLEVRFMDGIRRSASQIGVYIDEPPSPTDTTNNDNNNHPSVNLQYSLFPMDLSSTTSSVSCGTTPERVESA